MQSFIVIGLGVLIVWGVEVWPFPLDCDIAVNTGRTAVRLWCCQQKPQFFCLEISGPKVVENFRCTEPFGPRAPEASASPASWMIRPWIWNYTLTEHRRLIASGMPLTSNAVQRRHLNGPTPPAHLVCICKLRNLYAANEQKCGKL